MGNCGLVEVESDPPFPDAYNFSNATCASTGSVNLAPQSGCISIETERRRQLAFAGALQNILPMDLVNDVRGYTKLHYFDMTLHELIECSDARGPFSKLCDEIIYRKLSKYTMDALLTCEDQRRAISPFCSEMVDRKIAKCNRERIPLLFKPTNTTFVFRLSAHSKLSTEMDITIKFRITFYNLSIRSIVKFKVISQHKVHTHYIEMSRSGIRAWATTKHHGAWIKNKNYSWNSDALSKIKSFEVFWNWS